MWSPCKQRNKSECNNHSTQMYQLASVQTTQSISNPLSNKLELALLLLTHYIQNVGNTFFKIICLDSTCSICSVSQSALDHCAYCKLRDRKTSAECILQNNITCRYISIKKKHYNSTVNHV